MKISFAGDVAGLSHIYSRADLWRLSVLFLICVGTALFGLALNPVSGFAALIWPPTGIALAALILIGPRLWPAVFLGALAVNVFTGATPVIALGIALGNTFEALVGMAMLRIFGVPAYLERVRDVLALFLVAIFATAISATIGVMSLYAGGLVAHALLVWTWWAWWIGDALGVLVVLPFILAWRHEQSPLKLPFWRMAEGAAVGLTLFVIGLVIFGAVPGSNSSSPWVFVVFVVFLWSARLGQRNVATSAVILLLTVVWYLWRETGVFSQDTTSDVLFGVQVFIGVMSGTAMVLAAAIAERTHAIEMLKRHTEDLEYHRGLLMQGMAKDEALFQSIGEAIVVVGQDGRVALFNQAFRELHDGAGTDFLGRRLHDLWDLYDTEGHMIALPERPAAKALAGGSRSVRVRCIVVLKNGTRIPVAVTASPYLHEGDIIGVVVVVHDARKEEEIDRAKNEFVSLASHQLRTPLSVINWHLEAILSARAHQRMASPYRRYLLECFSATRRLLGMVSALLNISRIEANTFSIIPRPVALSRLVADVVESFDREIAHKEITIEQNFGVHPSPLPLDAGIMRMTLENLISNAVKYTPSGGKIRISITQKKDQVLIQIADTGYGIPKAVHEKIFSKFFRADNAAQQVPDGNGLGLYVVKSVLERAGGSITFTSSLGRGTRFTISLPISGMRSQQGNTTLT